MFYFNDPNDPNNKNCIYFTVSAYNTSIRNRFITGTNVIYQITGGSGKYLGATGTVSFVVDLDEIRNIEINIYY